MVGHPWYILIIDKYLYCCNDTVYITMYDDCIVLMIMMIAMIDIYIDIYWYWYIDIDIYCDDWYEDYDDCIYYDGL